MNSAASAPHAKVDQELHLRKTRSNRKRLMKIVSDVFISDGQTQMLFFKEFTFIRC